VYSEPEGLFPTVTFKDGINFIFGKKDDTNDPKNSLNGIGKSTFLDLIDFCLLASFNGNSNSRLFSAKEILEGHKIVLEFEISGKNYTIKRSVNKASEIEFGDFGNLSIYAVEEVKEILFGLIFDRDYPGKLLNTWLRKLLPFFLKIQRP